MTCQQKLKLIGVDVASFGEPFMPAARGLSIVYENKTKGLYKRINVSHDGKTLLGGILVGDTNDYNLLHQIYLNGMPLPKDIEELIIPSKEGTTNKMGVMQLLMKHRFVLVKMYQKVQFALDFHPGNTLI